MHDTEDEKTAWHEAGHAFAAAWLGASIESVSIDPDRDDGPQRFGDIIVQWDRSRFSDREIAEKSVLVALSGPVSEMLHCGDACHPAIVGEWSGDWELAWSTATFVSKKPARLKHLENVTRQLDHHWAAIGAIVDHLLAHDVLEGETVHEIVSDWVSIG